MLSDLRGRFFYPNLRTKINGKLISWFASFRKVINLNNCSSTNIDFDEIIITNHGKQFTFFELDEQQKSKPSLLPFLNFYPLRQMSWHIAQ